MQKRRTADLIADALHVVFMQNVAITTSRYSRQCNSFDIVCLSMCLLPLSQLNRQVTVFQWRFEMALMDHALKVFEWRCFGEP